VSLPKITADAVRSMKGRGRVSALTAYDFAMARLLDDAGVDVLLVGDSLGMVVLGYPDTTHVTMDDIEHHLRAAARAKPRALLGADLPYHSYETPADALANARRLVAAGAEFVKAEGGRTILPQVRAVLDAGIPVMGHVGMLCQHVLELGGYRIHGKNDAERDALLADAAALADAGVFAIVLELVTPLVAAEITRRVAVPTIGIGSGRECDGQILVTTDLLGTTPGFIPKHVKPRMSFATDARAAISGWINELRA